MSTENERQSSTPAASAPGTGDEAARTSDPGQRPYTSVTPLRSGREFVAFSKKGKSSPTLHLPLTELRYDLPAAVVVTLVALPLCLGIALASGAPLQSGIITGIIGGIVVSLASGSPLMVSGPAAGLVAIVLVAVEKLGSFEAVLPAVILAGVFQVGLGAMRAGVIGYFFPSSVIRGMLVSIGLILLLKQFPHVVGYDVDAFHEFDLVEPSGRALVHAYYDALSAAVQGLHWGAALVGGLSLVILVGWDKLGLTKRFRFLPGALVAVVAGTLLAEYGLYDSETLRIGATNLVQLPVPSSPIDFVAHLPTPDWRALLSPRLYTTALTLGVVASLETLLSLEATDKLDPLRRVSPANRELFAQGIGNVLSGLMGGLPMTGVIVRSSANIDAGGRTRTSAFTHGVLISLLALALPTVLNRIPLATLAAILVVTGYKLSDPRRFVAVYREGPRQFLPFIITVVAVLVSDLLTGITVGMATGFAFILVSNARQQPLIPVGPPGAVLRRYMLVEHLSFLNKAAVVRMLEATPAGSRLELDGRNCRYIDDDVLAVLHDFAETAVDRGIELRMVGIPARKGSRAAH